MAASQVLPAKDQAVFRSIVKFYETKQYKKGVKAADSILKKHPQHGETLCMKGLTVSYLDKKEEAYELVRQGLKYDLRSHVCWHVYGLLYRQDKDYVEAVKCYRQALKIDPENLQILKDLAILQIHKQDLTGFAETRRKLLQVKPSNRLNWVGYAISEHLCKNYEFAWTCCENYENTFKDDSVSEYENSELYMYKASIMEEAGRFEDALEALRQHEKSIVDKLNMMEMKARLCMFLGRFEDAKELYRKLIRVNPENHVYILGFMANHTEFHRFWPALPAPQAPGAKVEEGASAPAVPSTICSFPPSVHPLGSPIFGWLQPDHALKPHKRVAIGRRQHKKRLDVYEPLVPLTDDEEDLVIKLFDELAVEHPKSDSLQQLVLYFCTGKRFQRKLDPYLRLRLRKGIPSLFRMMRPLYFQPGKPALIEEMLMTYLQHLQGEPSWFGPKPGEESQSRAEGEEEPPTSFLFTQMMAAYHFDFVGETNKALSHADQALEHTPTLVEIYACKGRIYRHNGDLAESAKWFDDVRRMDLADRFLNSQCVKALLRDDRTQVGMETALLFSKEPDSTGAANLHEMQCMWYESAVGRSHWRQQNPGKALKQYNETFKHFTDIAEDKFDFHNYCLRKTTLKAYVGMLRMQEKLYSHKFFRRAAKDAITIYLDLYDRQKRGETISSGDKNGDIKEADMSAADKKKQKHKLAREAKKAEGDKGVPAAADGKAGKPKKVDDDPDGKKLLEKDSMEEATKLVKTLVVNCDLDFQTHTMTYEVASRQGRLLHCLQSLVRLWRLAGDDNLHYKLVAPLAHFCFVVDLDSQDISDVVREVILSELAPVLGSAAPFKNVADLRVAARKVAALVEDRMKNQSDLPVIEVLYNLRCLKHVGIDNKCFLEGWTPQCALALKECNKMMKYLASEYGQDSKILERFTARCLEVFPLMTSKKISEG